MPIFLDHGPVLPFDSLPFLLLFTPVAVAVFWSLPVGAPRLTWLTIASAAYYATYEWRFLPFLAFVTLVTYATGNAIAAGGRRQALLAMGVVAAFIPLAVFKYAAPLVWTTTDLAFPVGLSFYTFQSLTYCLDIFHGRRRPARSLVQEGPHHQWRAQYLPAGHRGRRQRCAWRARRTRGGVRRCR